jgi:hypothetical protein
MLTLGSERFAATGGVEAAGARRLLGTPRMSLLHTLLREAGQNSCDAALGQGDVTFRVRLRRLSSTQHAVLKGALEGALPPPADSTEKIARFLQSDAPLVLDICDFGTRGLGGPTRADEPSAEGVRTDFVDFIRNIGVSRDVAHGGGTYGYGKSVLYGASACSMILVDSLTDTNERRLIGCHLGNAIETGEARLTGRHWWGAPSDHAVGFVEPVTGAAAEAFARDLGLPERVLGASGTSVVILDPILEDGSLEANAGNMGEALLWYFWPRMLGSGHARLRCAIEVDGVPFALPAPDSYPPLDLFVEAWRAVKANAGAIDIASQRPKRHLGRIALRTGLRSPRMRLTPPEDSLAPAVSHHIAVMRPVDLVVRYYEGAQHPNDMQEWAGVFICDEDHDVEGAFARAEPPAHDDWDPSIMPRGHAKTFVNVALREIGRIAASYAVPAPAPVERQSAAQPALARASELLGAAVPAASRETGATSRRRQRAPAELLISQPAFVSLHEGKDAVEALFTVKAVNRSTRDVALRALPGLVVDGTLTRDRTGPDGDVTRVLRWEEVDGSVRSEEEVLRLPSDAGFEGRVRVSVPRLCAVGVELEAEGVGE